jgi:hypothetical protein
MCDCINRIDEQLKPMNARLGVGFALVGNKMETALQVVTVKLDTKVRKPVPTMYASFCPFCGEKTPVCPEGK